VFILARPSVWEVYRSNFLQGVHFISFLSLGSILHFLQGVYLCPPSGNYTHFIQGVHYSLSLSLGSISIELSTGCPFYLVPQCGKYIALFTWCPFYLVYQLGKYIALSTGCPFYLAPKGSVSHFLQMSILFCP